MWCVHHRVSVPNVSSLWHRSVSNVNLSMVVERGKGQSQKNIFLITSPLDGVARYCFSPGLSVCLSVCLCVCLSVCPANILVFYLSAIRRDIDLKFIQDTYRVVLNSLKKMSFTGQRSSYHKNRAIENFQIVFVDTSYDNLFDETITTRASREMTSQKNVNIWHPTCKTPIPQLILLIKSSKKSKKYGSHTAPSYWYSLSVCQIWWRSDVI